jgi:hypothetical protein
MDDDNAAEEPWSIDRIRRTYPLTTPAALALNLLFGYKETAARELLASEVKLPFDVMKINGRQVTPTLALLRLLDPADSPPAHVAHVVRDDGCRYYGCSNDLADPRDPAKLCEHHLAEALDAARRRILR